MRLSAVLVVVLSVWGFVPSYAGAIQVYYVRHAEAGHNVASELGRAGVPTNQWPAYAHSENAFSPKGEAQARSLAEAWQGQRFDLIAVSPKWRTRHTILPYLQASGQQAEIWPELGETPLFDLTVGGVAVAPATNLATGSTIRLAPEEQPVFLLGAHGVGVRECAVSNAAGALACAARVEARLRERFPGREARVLLVGHGNASVTLLRQLSRQPAFRAPHLGNVHGWRGVLYPDGGFTLEGIQLDPERLLEAPVATE